METDSYLGWFLAVSEDHHAEVQPSPKKEASLSVALSIYSTVGSLDLTQVHLRSLFSRLDVFV